MLFAFILFIILLPLFIVLVIYVFPLFIGFIILIFSMVISFISSIIKGEKSPIYSCGKIEPLSDYLLMEGDSDMSMIEILNIQRSWDLGLPIVLANASISKNISKGDTIFSACFENLSEKVIISAVFEFVIYNNNKVIKRIGSYQYDYLNAEKGELFGSGKLIKLDPDARNIDIMVKDITYKDGSTWENKSSQKFDISKYPKTRREFLGELDLDFIHKNNIDPDDYKYAPKQIDNCWICTCGKYNYDDDDGICKTCGKNKLTLLNLFDPSLLYKELEAPKSELETHEKQQSKIIRWFQMSSLTNIKKIIVIVIIVIISILLVNLLVEHLVEHREIEKAKETCIESFKEIVGEENLDVLNVTFEFVEKDTDYNGDLSEGGSIYNARIEVVGFNRIEIGKKFELFSDLRMKYIDTPYVFSVEEFSILSEGKEWFKLRYAEVITTSDSETFYKPKDNNSSNSIKYDSNDYYYRSNDYNNDGELSGDEWSDALDDYLTDLGY